jgi:hypothetical protein
MTAAHAGALPDEQNEAWVADASGASVTGVPGVTSKAAPGIDQDGVDREAAAQRDHPHCRPVRAKGALGYVALGWPAARNSHKNGQLGGGKHLVDELLGHLAQLEVAIRMPLAWSMTAREPSGIARVGESGRKARSVVSMMISGLLCDVVAGEGHATVSRTRA